MRNSFSHTSWKIIALFLVLSSFGMVAQGKNASNPFGSFDLNDIPTTDEIQKLLLPFLLTKPDPSTCMGFLHDLYATPHKYFEPFMATGKGLNDYGDQFACRRLKNYTYLLAVVKILPGTNRAVLGLCVPSQCSAEEYTKNKETFKEALSKVTGLQQSGFDLVVVDPHEQEDVEADGATYFTYCLMGTIILLGTLGSIYDLQGDRSSGRGSHKHKAAPTSVEFSEVSNFSARPTQIGTDADDTESNVTQSSEKPMGQVLLTEQKAQASHSGHSGHSGKPRLNFVNLCKCFSFYTNGKKLFTISKITDSNASTECLNGFRIFTMVWVILGHTYYYHLRAPVQNLGEWKSLITPFRNQPLVAAPLAVDSFLYLGGFLGAYLMVKEIKKRRGRLNFLQVWIHRFYRIIPLYLLIVLFGWKIMPQFVIGVGGYNFKELMDSDCVGNWWANILFVNNYFPRGQIATCFGYSWYLAVDMQCFLPLPLLLVLYYKNRMAGWITAWVLFAGSIILWFVGGMIGNWSADFTWTYEHMTEYFEFYTKPYYRFGPYALGIITGFIITEYQDDTLGYNIFAKKVHRFMQKRLNRYINYAVGSIILTWSIYIHYPLNNGDAAANWSQFTKSLFLSTQRSIWVVGWMMFIIPAMMGWGSLLRGVLGASFWSPLVRLTFGTYLIHPILQVWYYWNVEQSWLIGHLDTFINCVGFLMASFILAACFSLMAEAPAMNLEKFWMPAHKKSGEEHKA